MGIGKLSLIDLAGSERAAQMKNTGQRLVEGANINRSLLALGKCINALSTNPNKYVPYRESKLTRLLKESLGGNCRTVIIANVSPSWSYYDDTWNTLQYANRAHEITSKVAQNGIYFFSSMRQTFPDDLESFNKYEEFAIQEETVIERANQRDTATLEPIKSAIQVEINKCARSLKELQDLYEKRQEILSLQLQKEQEVSLLPNNSILREELHLLQTSYKLYSTALDRIKNMLPTSAQSIKFRLQIDSLQLAISSNKYVLYDLLTRFQSYFESINYLITNKSLELEIQMLKNQLEKQQKEQPIHYLPHNSIFCPSTVQKQSLFNRRVSLIPITPARTLINPEKLGTSIKRNNNVVPPRTQYPTYVHPDRSILRLSNIPNTSKKPPQVPRQRVTRENAIPKKITNDYKRSFYSKPLVTKNHY